jgi:hypothetical protein
VLNRSIRETCSPMNIQTSSRVVTLRAPFRLASCAGELAAGDYTLVALDEVITGDTFSASRRLSTALIPPGPQGVTRIGRGHATSPWEIARLLKADAALHDGLGVSGQAAMNGESEGS